MNDTQPAADPVATAITQLLTQLTTIQDQCPKYGATWYALARARTEILEAGQHAGNGH
jgi:hypothetical protein